MHPQLSWLVVWPPTYFFDTCKLIHQYEGMQRRRPVKTKCANGHQIGKDALRPWVSGC